MSMAGGLVGVLLAFWMMEPLRALAPKSLPVGAVQLDAPVLLFSLGLSLLTGLLFGLLPALRSSRPSLQPALKEGGLHAGMGRSGVRTRQLLVVSEVALAVVLLAGAGLLVRSFWGLRTTEPGFDPAGILTVKLSLPEAKYGAPAALASFERQLLERVQALPGVRVAAGAATLPMELGPDLNFHITGRSGEAGEGNAQYRAVTPGYFDVLRIGRVKGRDITWADGEGAPGAVVINEAVARKYWPNVDPLGQRIQIGLGAHVGEDDDPQYEVVGVVKDVHEEGLERAAPPILYVPMSQVPEPLSRMMVRLLPHNLLLRADVAPQGLVKAVRDQVWAVDPHQPTTNELLMEEIVAHSLETQKFHALLLGALAALGLTLAAVGIYGVLSYLVGQRTREMGIRRALGARDGQVLRLVVGQGVRLTAVGCALGLAVAWGCSRLVAGLVYGVTPSDPATLLGAALSLGLVGLLASWIPARRATGVDPAITLRSE